MPILLGPSCPALNLRPLQIWDYASFEEQEESLTWLTPKCDTQGGLLFGDQLANADFQLLSSFWIRPIEELGDMLEKIVFLFLFVVFKL